MKIVLWIGGIVMLLSSIAVLYYRFSDEDLEPAVAKVIEYKQKDIENNQNGYLYLLGLFAGKDHDLTQHGLYILEQAKKKYLASGDALSVISEIEGVHVTVPGPGADKLCNWSENLCLDDIKSNIKKYTDITNSNRILIKRLAGLGKFSQFQETQYLLGFEKLLLTQKLFLTEIALVWHRGDRKKALVALDEHINFFRMAASSEVSLITRMISIVMVNRGYSLLSELITDCRGCEEIDSYMQSLRKPFIQDEFSMRHVMGSEFRYAARMTVEHIENEIAENKSARIGYKLLFKKNSTLNKIYRVHAKIIELGECNIKNYIMCEEKYDRLAYAEPDYYSWEFVKDPIGSILVAIAQPAFNSYARKGFELEALRRLLLAKYILHRDRVPDDRVQDRLGTMPADLQNPFNGKTIQFDKDTRSLVLKAGHDERIDLKFRL